MLKYIGSIVVMLLAVIVLCFLSTAFKEVDPTTASLEKDFVLVENLKAECEEVHQAPCEISVYYLPKAVK